MNACPRCTSRHGQLCGRSRTTVNRDIPICGPCAQAEAQRDVAGQAPIPPNEWPVGAGQGGGVSV